jgi:DNA (cytosine-5)-methyltransferase 1
MDYLINNSIEKKQLTVEYYNNIETVKTDFTFIDLFAGIGGFRFAFESVGGKCVFSSEYDKYSQMTYKAFFGEKPDFSNIMKVDPPGDITQLDPNLIPDHDILTGGFPCQPFSLAGVSKKNSLNRQHGFNDKTQGTLFFNIKNIIAVKRPKAFILENVKHLLRHDNGKTFSIIFNTLRELNYNVYYRVIDANGWVPQHRARIFIIGFDNNKRWQIDSFPELNYISPPKKGRDLSEIIEKRVPEKYTLGPGTWSTLVRHKKNHIKKGQGFGYSIISPPFSGKTTRTLSARYHKDGSEILLSQNGNRPRRLTPLECLRLMGFPKCCEKFFDRTVKTQQPVSDTQAYRQFGNAVVVPLVKDLAVCLIKRLLKEEAL